MSPFRLLLTAQALCPSVASAKADILIGNYGDGTTPEPLRAFADDANGDVVLLRIPGGRSSSLKSPVGGRFESTEDVIYLADFRGRALRVLPAWADGDVAPVRVFDSARVGQTRSVALDTGHDELITS